MDKNKIKLFAIWARRSLIALVSEKANRIGIYEDRIVEAIEVQGGFKLEGKDDIFSLSKSDRDALIRQINEKGFQQVMEEVAYTWFNRFIGLRYMEVNDYLPSGVRILSSEVEGKNEPDVLTKVSEIIDELELNANEIYDLLDTGNNLDREKAYRIILVKQCNELGKIIPQMFEKISDYTELLLPDNLLEEGSVIRKMVEDIEESDWLEEVEIIGWMYQYYISEKKDEVFAALKKNVKITKENIPAATQLFTPKWIVKYMVENSLGRLWLEGHPNKELQSKWKYYLEEAEQEPEVEKDLEKIREEHSKLTPEDIKVLDPCMGSGHILVYAFDVLYEIYKSVGYSEREIPRMILQNNLYGLDIDDRAAQLASFALIMKARHYNRRLFREIEREHLELNLCSIQESNEITDGAIEYFANGNEELKKDVKYLVDIFIDAKEYGSILKVKKVNFRELKERLKEIEDEDNFIFDDYRKMFLNKLSIIIKQAEIMSSKYEVSITNPPYMAVGKVSVKLNKYVTQNYTLTKKDLFSVMIEKSIKFTKKNCYISMITQHTWINSNTYKLFREKLLKENVLKLLVYLGTGAFEEIDGEVVNTAAITISNFKKVNFKPKFIELINFDNKEKHFYDSSNVYCNLTQKQFNNIPKIALAYKATKSIINVLNYSGNKIQIKAGRGLQTGDDDKFLRLWYEVNIEKTNILQGKCKKWFLINKGGTYRKWYGNNEWIVLWQNAGEKIKKDHFNGKISATLRNLDTFFSGALTYTYITGGKFNARYCDNRYCYSGAGAAISSTDNYYTLGFYNSKVFMEFIQCIKGNTIRYEVGDIETIPVFECKQEISNIIRTIVKENILLCRDEWNSFELAWDFKIHPLLKLVGKNENYKIETIFRRWESDCEENFKQLKYNEEELNKIFIDIYGLQDELTPEEEDTDVTIRKADRERDIKSLISYAVGCMFGRYSIDSEGLIYAGGDFNDKWNFESSKVRKIEKDTDGNIISDSWVDSRFMPNKENIIPITEDEYFEDDIVSRFIEFVRIIYGNDTLEENLDFIADSIDRKSSETSRQAIRRYFIKDFYKDHLKVYQKRPIYWMFESGKNNGFKCLIYMHRYNEQTIAKVRTDYLHILQRKYESEINRLQLVVDSEEYTAKDRTATKKKIDRISKQIEECREYDQVVAYLANEKIFIDLDDGVKINYTKFQNINVINSKGKEVKMNLLEKI